MPLMKRSRKRLYAIAWCLKLRHYREHNALSPTLRDVTLAKHRARFFGRGLQ